MELIPIKTKVRIKDADIIGVVIGVTLREKTVEYQICYYIGGEQKHPWVWDWEIEPVVDNRTQAGFIKTTEITKA